MIPLNLENLINQLYEKELDKITEKILILSLGKEEKSENSCGSTRALSLGTRASSFRLRKEKIKSSRDLNPLCTISFNENKFEFFETEPDEPFEMDGLKKRVEKYISNRISSTLLGMEARVTDSFIESKFDGFETESDRKQSDPERKMRKYIFKRPKFFFKLNNSFFEGRNDLCMRKKIVDWETETDKLNLSISLSQSDTELGKTGKPLVEEDFIDWMFDSPRAASDSDSDWVRFTEKKSDFFEIESDDETYKVKKCISKPPKYPYKMDELKKKMEKIGTQNYTK